MKYISVCSGIESATVAWHRMGWTPLAFSEIEPFPCKVLAHHYPEVPNLGDMTKFHEWSNYEPDILVGGTPCQSFSIAGLRKGLDDPRGNLMLTYLAIADRYKPQYLLWENVPGVLSSNGGRDFGTFLGALGKLGYGFAYRVLDAQMCRTDGHPYAVPQRRRRVFVVGCLGSWQRAAAVLFDSESLRGNPPPRREAGKSVTGTLGARATAGGGLGTDFDLAGGLQVACEVADTLSIGANQTTGRPGDICAVAHSLRGEGFDASEDGTGRGTPIVTCMAHGQGGAEITEGYAPTLNCNHEQPIVYPIDLRNAGRDPEKLDAMNRQGVGIGENGDPACTLSKAFTHAVAFSAGNSSGARSIGYSEEHTPPLRAGASGTNMTPTICFEPGIAKRDGSESRFSVEDTSTLRKDMGDNQPAVAFAQNTRDEVREMAVPGALAAQPGMKQTSYLRQGMQVRRLLPIECEKLQGFPPGYTNIPGASDSARYKALGNSMAVNVMQLLGQRIQMVDALDL